MTRKAVHRALFHLDSGSRSAMLKTLRNIRNLLKDPRLEGRVRVELVVNGLGARLYKKSGALAPEVAALAREGVDFVLCANTLAALGVDPRSLPPFVRIVPSAMGEIVLRAGEGWACIHPSP